MTTNSSLDFWRGTLAVLVLVALTGTSATAQADDSMQDEWYGWQIMPVDAASVGLMVCGMAELEQTAMFSGFAGYALGGPIVHLAHEQWWKSVGSLGLRLGVPTTSVLIASAFSSSSGNSQAAFADAMGKGILALGLGAVAAMALDYIFLARKPMPSSNSSASQVQMLQLRWQF
ncbi:hypothetical protein FIV42_29630 [Persicimonas caeni]|uniref:Uncharacterized protein n=1 Tax=Persicimonas caeni TaxID=2292766 RepID=A0A4Y6Q2D6_PERCE|nr:hypothetical protein [Persicimonas caeni]QDG54758.1 hypothetical protein FIV42_29630 [Persicimonas caeni]QED35979.1 hypothetical protein FRD00_29625 [Persicimonas caeni]